MLFSNICYSLFVTNKIFNEIDPNIVIFLRVLANISRCDNNNYDSTRLIDFNN